MRRFDAQLTIVEEKATADFVIEEKFRSAKASTVLAALFDVAVQKREASIVGIVLAQERSTYRVAAGSILRQRERDVNRAQSDGAALNRKL